MTNMRIMELMNQEIDGVNSSAESLELEEHLDRHPESRRLMDELREAVGIFEKVPQFEPPFGLRASILASTGLDQPTAKDNWWTGLMTFFSPLMKPALTAAFAIGLMAGIVLVHGYRIWQEDLEGTTAAHLQGMAGHGRDTLSMGPALTRSIGGNSVTGAISLAAGPLTGLLTLEIQTPTPATVHLELGPDWTGAGFRTLDGGASDLRIEEGLVTFKSVGAGLWEINLLRTHGGKDPITLKVYYKGELVTEQSVVVQE